MSEKIFLILFFLTVRKNFFTLLDGTLSEIWRRGGGGRPNNFPAGRHRISQGKLADTPQLKGAIFAPGREVTL
jgi:hypothetical protein